MSKDPKGTLFNTNEARKNALIAIQVLCVIPRLTLLVLVGTQQRFADRSQWTLNVLDCSPTILGPESISWDANIKLDLLSLLNVCEPNFLWSTSQVGDATLFPYLHLKNTSRIRLLRDNDQLIHAVECRPSFFVIAIDFAVIVRSEYKFLTDRVVLCLRCKLFEFPLQGIRSLYFTPSKSPKMKSILYNRLRVNVGTTGNDDEDDILQNGNKYVANRSKICIAHISSRNSSRETFLLMVWVVTLPKGIPNSSKRRRVIGSKLWNARRNWK
jgi:hypothetical protein